MLDVIHVIIQGILGTGLLYGGYTTLANWHLSDGGPSVQNVRPGDRVMVPFNVFCGTCYFCARGLYSNCHNVNPNATAVGGIYGYSHTCGGFDGGQAEYVRVPFADVGPPCC